MQPWKTVLEVCFWLALAAVFFFGGLLAYRIHIKKVMKTGSRSRWIGLPALMAVLGACYLLVLAAFGSAVAVRRSIRTRGFSYDAPDSIYGLPDALDPAAFAEAASSEKEVLVTGGDVFQLYYSSDLKLVDFISGGLYVNRLSTYVYFCGSLNGNQIVFTTKDRGDYESLDLSSKTDEYLSIADCSKLVKNLDVSKMIDSKLNKRFYLEFTVFNSGSVPSDYYGLVFENKEIIDYSSFPYSHSGWFLSSRYFVESGINSNTGEITYKYSNSWCVF